MATSPLAGHAEYWQAFGQAWLLRNEVRVQRTQLQKARQRTLADVFRQIETQMSRPEVRLLDRFSAPVRPYMHPEAAVITQ